MAKRHKGDTKEFHELTFAEQAKSITAMINVLQRACLHHTKHSTRRDETAAKCVAQLNRLVTRVQATLGPPPRKI